MLNLVSRLEAYRAEEQQLAWQGTFKEYFDQVVANNCVDHDPGEPPVSGVVRNTP